jgi:hypothetical protein
VNAIYSGELKIEFEDEFEYSIIAIAALRGRRTVR